jgi:hypothetical protein
MKITLTRVEGKVTEADKQVKREDFHAANIMLTIWSRTAPKDGGYDKCDFTVEFDNGDVYEGQYDLVHPSVGGLPDLRKHIRESLEWMAAEQAAPHWPEEYRRAAAEMLKEHRDVLAVF